MFRWFRCGKLLQTKTRVMASMNLEIDQCVNDP